MADQTVTPEQEAAYRASYPDAAEFERRGFTVVGTCSCGRPVISEAPVLVDGMYLYALRVSVRIDDCQCVRALRQQMANDRLGDDHV